MLDEMSALGRLAMVEPANGLMTGFGMQLWGVVQDLSQLESILRQGLGKPSSATPGSCNISAAAIVAPPGFFQALRLNHLGGIIF